MRVLLAVVAALCLVVAIGAVVYASCTASAPEVVRAQRFELVDDEGTVRALLVAGAEGAGLTVCDEKGQVRATLDVTKVGPAVALFDARGAESAVLVARAEGPVLELYDAQGEVLWHGPAAAGR